MRRGGRLACAGTHKADGAGNGLGPARVGVRAGLLVALVAACGSAGSPGEDPGAEDTTGALADTTAAVDTIPVGIALVEEVFETERDTLDDVDSPTVWHGDEGQHWVLTTAKATDVVIVNDAATGAEVRRIGGTGSGAGQLDRPNGVTAIDDLLIVVERDNARLQAFSLPGLEPLGTFGEEQLRRPYGIAAYQDDQGRAVLYVTDNYELVEDEIPPDSLLGERVEQFRVWLEDGELHHEHVRTFGETTGAGVLRKVETIGVDAANNRVVIAEELEPGSHWKIYGLDGRFSGQVFGRGYFPHEAEGLALYACADGGGYWVATDQDEETNTFHVFDRRTLEHLGAFSGATTRNTDGVALTQTGFGPFPAGAFYAVHNDGNIAGFSWAEIAEELGLRSDCRG
ncbi:MAG TPA: phytase [Gemmatimonadota bacterium]|nr:phytase [Gemmatimonadota bacterium]